jgi:hypothetical protein
MATLCWVSLVNRSRKVVIQDNQQQRNRGKPSIGKKDGDKDAAQAEGALPPMKPCDAKAMQRLKEMENARWLKRVRRHGGGASISEAHFSSADGARVPAEGQKRLQDMIDRRISASRACWRCGAAEDLSLGKLLTCARCRMAVYCSRACQKRHWKDGGHKGECQPYCEFPCAGNATRDVRD